MDSVTQFALGATIGLATLGRRMGARKAAVTGGLLATLPDLDVLIPFDNPVDDFVLHRGATHSLIMQTLATPLIAETLRRAVPSLREFRWHTWLTVFLCLTTHALLDAMTVYGTQLFWPLWPEPVGLGSIFIIDPLYTVPLLTVMVWAMFVKNWPNRLRTASAAALMISTAYLGWSAVAQQIAKARGERTLAAAGLAAERIMATPTPFNTLFWRVIAVDGPRYYNIYVPLLGGDGATTAYRHGRGQVSARCLAENETIRTLAEFSDGFFRIDSEDGAFVVSDLRMGLTPDYVFRFAVAPEHPAGVARSVMGTHDESYPHQLRPRRDFESDLIWLKAGIAGNRAVRPAESGHMLSGQSGNISSGTSGRMATC